MHLYLPATHISISIAQLVDLQVTLLNQYQTDRYTNWVGNFRYLGR